VLNILVNYINKRAEKYKSVFNFLLPLICNLYFYSIQQTINCPMLDDNNTINMNYKLQLVYMNIIIYNRYVLIYYIHIHVLTEVKKTVKLKYI